MKAAWFYDKVGNYVVDNRRTKTNRRRMIRGKYGLEDFQFALVYVEELDLFYVFPVEVFIGYRSGIHLVEADRRQRRPQSASYRDAWQLIVQWATREETRVGSPVKFGEAVGEVTPSQASVMKVTEEGVET